VRLGAGKNFLNSFLISGLSLFAAYLPPQYVSATRSSLRFVLLGYSVQSLPAEKPIESAVVGKLLLTTTLSWQVDSGVGPLLGGRRR
jgi:hypothetical protein